MSEKRILVVPRGSGLSKEDRKALYEAGIIVVTVKVPADAKLLTSEPFPASSNDLLFAAAKGLEGSGTTTKSIAWDALMKAVLANQKTKS